MKLAEVFGISANVQSRSYVDRGGLDARFERALTLDRHVAVHGGSKQGKSWLRAKGLRPEDALIVQCVPDSTVSSLLAEALGRLGVLATLMVTKDRALQGSLDFGGSGELGKWAAKAAIEARATGGFEASKTIEGEPIGQSSGDLAWVARTLVASRRRLVFEDFHYLGEVVQRDFAFLLKAMGEYGLYVIVIGVWPQDNLLTYYNGELDGRITDIHLHWVDHELARVLQQGASALGVEFSPELQAAVIRESYGSVGTLQRLAESVCELNGILETRSNWSLRPTVRIEPDDKWLAAQGSVAGDMQSRYQTFADNFVRGMRRLPEGLEVYKHLLQAATEGTDQELLDGLDSALLLHRIVTELGAPGIRASDLTQALERIDRLQSKIAVHPPVLTYNKASRKLILADRSFLFYRRHATHPWPWSTGEPHFSNDLAIQDPLDFEY